MLLNSYLHGIYWGIMKILIIREAFKLRLSLRMTLNNENPFQTTAKRSSSSPYLEITILLYKYGLLYLPTYHKSLCPNFFLEKVWLEDTLPTYSLDICPKFRRFFLLDPLLTLFQVRNIFAHLWSVTEALQFYKGFQGCSFKAPVI